MFRHRYIVSFKFICSCTFIWQLAVIDAISASNRSLSFTSYTAVGNLSIEFRLELIHCPIYYPLLMIFCQTLDFAFAAMLYSERKGRTHEASWTQTAGLRTCSVLVRPFLCGRGERMGRQGRKLRVDTCSALARPLLFLINITAKRKQGCFAFSACRFIYTNTKILPMQKLHREFVIQILKC